MQRGASRRRGASWSRVALASELRVNAGWLPRTAQKQKRKKTVRNKCRRPRDPCVREPERDPECKQNTLTKTITITASNTRSKPAIIPVSFAFMGLSKWRSRCRCAFIFVLFHFSRRRRLRPDGRFPCPVDGVKSISCRIIFISQWKAWRIFDTLFYFRRRTIAQHAASTLSHPLTQYYALNNFSGKRASRFFIYFIKIDLFIFHVHVSIQNFL